MLKYRNTNINNFLISSVIGMIALITASCGQAGSESSHSVVTASGTESVEGTSIIEAVPAEDADLKSGEYPERALYEKVISGETRAKYLYDGQTYEQGVFPQGEWEKHTFIDLNGDGIVEMYMRNMVFGWPHSIYTIKDNEVWTFEMDEDFNIGTSGILESVYFDSDNNIIIQEHLHVGRESCHIFHVQDGVIRHIDGYHREWEQYDESLPSHSYHSGSDEEISAEEYDQAIENIMSKVVEPEWIEQRTD